jgi:hypothetical protein
MEQICGFMVVRKPEYAKEGDLKPSMQVGKKIYRGVDRLPWEDFDAAYWDRGLPSDLMPIREELEQSKSDFSGLALLKSYEKAEKVLNFSGEKSEIVAIWSPHIESIKGGMYTEVSLSYLGIDCFCLGEWSILQAGVYEMPEHFQEVIMNLNEYGLLTSNDECDGLFVRYMELASSELVEPLREHPQMTSIKVFNVK